MKYVTDKFKGVKYADITVPDGGGFDDLVALKGTKNIGEGMDKVIAKLAEAGENNLRGVIDNAHFNDGAKLGSGKEMVDRLTGLIQFSSVLSSILRAIKPAVMISLAMPTNI